MIVVKISLLSHINRGFYYNAGDVDVNIGDLVSVPFRRSLESGICIEKFESIPNKEGVLVDADGVNQSKMKAVESVVCASVFSASSIEFLKVFASYNALPFGSVLEIAVPDVLTNAVTHKNAKRYRLSPNYRHIIDDIKAIVPKVSPTVKKACANVVVAMQDVADFGGGIMQMNELTEALGARVETVEKLINLGILVEVKDGEGNNNAGGGDAVAVAGDGECGVGEGENPAKAGGDHKLNDDQIAAVNAICGEGSAAGGGNEDGGSPLEKYSTTLLYGVTGSGKTETYYEIINRLMGFFARKPAGQRDAQVLILLPEITMTDTVLRKFEDRLGFKPVIWHSSISVVEKRNSIIKIVNGSARIIVGTRSSAFLPYKNLKMIIVDEEHDSSYKQSEFPTYNARDMAVMRGNMCGFPVVLGSATPSVESYWNAMSGKYKLVKMLKRYGVAQLPKITILDLLSKSAGSLKAGDRTTDIAAPSIAKITHAIGKGEQVMIFINRRGYSRSMMCKECKHIYGCENCDNNLTYHKGKDFLKCHYCNFAFKPKNVCSECGAEDSNAEFGSAGVEKIKEQIDTFFSGKVKTAVVSSDVTGNADATHDLFTDIEGGKVDVIIGTQIVTKGHNFPNLSLVIALGVDAMNLEYDAKMYERMYQLLVQVSGRAGRFGTSGEVVVQTCEPSNPVLQSMVSGVEDHFYKEEIKRRRVSSLPPFSKQIAIIVACEDDTSARGEVGDIYKKLHSLKGTDAKFSSVKILGPVSNQIKYLKRQFRYHILLQGKSSSALKEMAIKCADRAKSQKIMIKIDVDPQSIM